MTNHVQINQQGPVVKIHLNRPEKKNALTVEMYTAIADAIETANADTSVRAVFFSGEGESFCAGNDLQDFMARPPTGPDSPVLRFLKTLRESDVALIAAVQGKAVGVGATMLLHTDHVVLTPDAELHFNFIKMALVPEAASSMLLPQYVGRQRAAEILMTGHPVLADEALATGLAAHVVSPKDAMPTALAFADKISTLAPAALRETKQLMQRPPEDLAARMHAENLMFMQRLGSPEFAEAVTAFMQKRPPNFG
ncbi:enoyl-CoA hydratase-related protein [Parasulfitobacter algicola]|uniref:Enoyl-CoA hydratase/isomerase family protein n=1 Tax=Parasulfitobacter algicola TaxID=2614809 RepID=A0ABX2IMG3_9RHOB|nr:enoyl-CoA hydratase-related protein [Sulfitobacter algicola]NSX54077.1 enoyl-CoA hydratase/isomerase family protein [Sulfitobacter algicola]